MHVEDEVFRLRKRVKLLEDKMEMVFGELGLQFVEREQSVSDEVLDLLRRGNKLSAVKLYRELTGTSLKASKEAVERMEDQIDPR